MNFKNYVHSIDMYPDEMFDLVIIDGRARCGCIRSSMNKVKRGGYILLDNSHRTWYDNGKRLLDGWSHISFKGIVPFSYNISETTIWKKPS